MVHLLQQYLAGCDPASMFLYLDLLAVNQHELHKPKATAQQQSEDISGMAEVIKLTSGAAGVGSRRMHGSYLRLAMLQVLFFCMRGRMNML